MMLPFLISVNEVENVSREMAEWWNDPVSTFFLYTLSYSFPLSSVGRWDLRDTLTEMELYSSSKMGMENWRAFSVGNYIGFWRQDNF